MGAAEAAFSYATLPAMIIPALFMTSTGSLLISTSNRMSRIVDRIRVLNDMGDELCRGKPGMDYVAERLEHVSDQLRRLEWRSDRIRNALSVLYFAFGLFVASSLSLALDVQLGRRIVFVPTLLAVSGTFTMLFACVNLFREAREALRSNRLEIKFFRELQARRRSEGGCAG